MTSASNQYTTVADLAPQEAALTAIRRHLHQHPELSFEEAQTAAFIAAKLEGWGYAVTRGVGGHGVVGVLRQGEGGRSVAIRADIDALPIAEATGLPYASTVPGTMHACGHDGHTTVLLGAAEHLARTRRFNGTVVLVFQPAEEAGLVSGAQRMIADGLFERFPCDAIFGLHNHPGVPVGTILTRPGPMMAAGDTVYVRVKGQGGHAARPHQAVDPIVTAAAIVMALQTVVARSIDPNEAAVVTVGTLHGGTATNVIPDTAELGLSVRSFTPQTRQRLESRIRDIVTNTAAAQGASVEITWEHGYPVVMNSEAETAFAAEVARELVGEGQVGTCPMLTGSEDFAYYLQHKPGSFLRLGNGEGSAMLHNPRYDFADASLTTGAALWARLAERFLERV
jgi:hippurate hydrolase